MKKVLAVGLLLAGGAFAASWTGVISDEHCGAKHLALTPEDKACINTCVKGGSPAVFVAADNKIYKIDNQGAVKNHLGQKVTITGDMKGDTIHVDSVKM